MLHPLLAVEVCICPQTISHEKTVRRKISLQVLKFPQGLDYFGALICWCESQKWMMSPAQTNPSLLKLPGQPVLTVPCLLMLPLLAVPYLPLLKGP